MFEKGITIIELILVVTIISTLGIFSASYYSRFLTQNAVNNLVDQLVSSLRKAQIYSMTGKQNGLWGVKYDALGSPKKITFYFTGNTAFDENFNINDNIIVSGFTDISFAKVSGSRIPAPPPDLITITITGLNNTKTITVNSQGVASRTN